jgi:hypothetical protein
MGGYASKCGAVERLSQRTVTWCARLAWFLNERAPLDESFLVSACATHILLLLHCAVDISQLLLCFQGEQMTQGTRNSTASAAAEAGAVAQATGLAQSARPGLEEAQQNLLEIAERCFNTDYRVQQLEQQLLR